MNGTRPRKRWSELSRRERSTIGAAIALQLSLLTAAQIDLLRRPAKEVRGDKRLWRVVSFLNFAGPLAYFAFGRKR
jgi:Phospholipase_D-nuclease N-terminal